MLSAAVGVVAKSRAESAERVDTTLEDGTHVVFLFATNGHPDDERLERGIPAAIDSVRKFAKARGSHFTTVGVNIAWNTERGGEFLSHFGRFDEVSLGRRYMNSAADVYINNTGGEQSMPQVTILAQDVTALAARFSMRPPRPVLRLLGREQIARWMQDGSHVPTF